MDIKVLDNYRGVYAIYNGCEKKGGYIIYSRFYGIIARSTNIIEDDARKKITIFFDMCDWSGYWDVYPIITKGVTALERQFVKKKVDIIYNVRKESGNSLHNYYNLEVKCTKKYNKK